jgi:hypothetical protein
VSEPRFDTFIWTQFELGAATGQGSIQNIGPGGLFIRSSTTGRTGDEIRLSFEGPDGETVEAIGVIWWTRRDLGGRGPGEHGFGVRLVASSGAYRSLLRSLERPGRQTPRRDPRESL